MSKSNKVIQLLIIIFIMKALVLENFLLMKLDILFFLIVEKGKKF